MIAWVYLLLAFGALAVAFKTASIGVMALSLLVALGLILAWVMALLAQRIGSRSRAEHAMIDPDELRRMREQAEKYGASIETGRVSRLERIDGGFEAEWGAGTATARTLLFATGVKNRRPDMDEELHDSALAQGLIRYCPICDGYEVTDKKVGVIGSGSHGVAEALFLRSYTADVTLIAPGEAHDLRSEDQERLEEHGIPAVDGPSRGVAVHESCIVVETAEGHYTFDSVYPALGSDTHTELAEQIGVALNESGCIGSRMTRTRRAGSR